MFANGERCSTPQEIYAGRWAVITVRPFTWSHPTGGNGVSFGLSNVLLLDHDDPIGSVRANAEAEFADLFVAADSAAAKVVAAGNGTGTFGDRGATRDPTHCSINQLPGGGFLHRGARASMFRKTACGCRRGVESVTRPKAVIARTFSLSLRPMLRRVIAGGPAPLDRLDRRVSRSAGSPRSR